MLPVAYGSMSKSFQINCVEQVSLFQSGMKHQPTSSLTGKKEHKCNVWICSSQILIPNVVAKVG